MRAEEQLQQGHPDDALRLLQDEVRKEPSNPKLRVFLFQLLSIQGQWDRALNQLKIAGDLDAGNLMMAQTYREAIQCEVLRQRIFSGQTAPMVFGEPEQWIALLVEALRLTADGNFSGAQGLREQALEQARASSGQVNGQQISWLADADSRFGPVLEAIVNGRYYWVPFRQISRVDLEQPADLRDFVWMPAHFVWKNGGEAYGLIPTRYPASELETDFSLRLCRRTEWYEPYPGCYLGLGQRILASDADEYPIMDIREICLDSE